MSLIDPISKRTAILTLFSAVIICSITEAVNNPISYESQINDCDVIKFNGEYYIQGNWLKGDMLSSRDLVSGAQTERLAEQVESLESRLMLFFTGFVRYASDIAAEQIRQTPKKKEELSQMHSMGDEAVKILSEQTDIDDFGRLLHEAWLLKKNLTSKTYCSSIK